jgi:hypothetical protein
MSNIAERFFSGKKIAKDVLGFLLQLSFPNAFPSFPNPFPKSSTLN